MTRNAKHGRIRRIVLTVLRVLAVLLVVLYVVLSPRVSARLYMHRLFHPDENKGSMAALLAFDSVENHKVAFIARDGSKLRGWIFINPGSTKIFLVHPGNAGDIPMYLPFIKLLLKTGASVFTYETRGYGESEGHPTVQHICEDGISAFDEVLRLGYTKEQIILYGVSLGASVATCVSTERQAKGIILQSGFSSLGAVARERVGFLKIYPDFMFPNPRLDNAAIMSKPHVPLLILHGEKDTLIPIHHGQEIARRAGSNTTFVVCPNSGHMDIDPRDEEVFVTAIKSFLDKLK